MTLDLAFVRSQFPALADGFAYFDNAGGSLVLRNVAERISDYLLTTSVQTGASYEHSKRASERLLESRAKIARLLNASRPDEIVLGPSTTVLCQFLARAMENNLKPGDEIVVTNFDHESNIGAWRALEKRGIVIKEWCIERDGYEIDLDALDRVMTERTKLVAVTHASNILGTINPIKEIARRVHERGAANRRRCSSVCATQSRRRDRPRRGLLHLQLLQNLRPAFRRHVRQIRQAPRTRRPLSLLLRPRQSADEA